MTTESPVAQAKETSPAPEAAESTFQDVDMALVEQPGPSKPERKGLSNTFYWPFWFVEETI